jgi:V-type H+-transporting ATPase subunit E
MGGVKLTNKAGTITVDNTLNGRMEVVLQQQLPDIKIALFGRSATRTHIDRDM